jgi:PAS domain S-box-containing protein
MRKIKKNPVTHSHDIIHAILEVAPIGIFVVGNKGNIDYVNAAMSTLSGDSYEQITSLNTFKNPSFKKIDLDKKINAVFDGHAFSLMSAPWTSPYSKKTLIGNFVGIPLEEMGEKKALVFVEDITQIKQAEQEMVQAVNIKSHFISLASHELRSPLGLIAMYITGLLSGMKGELTSEQKKHLGVAKRTIDRLVRLVSDVLNYQRLEAGKMEFKMEENDVHALIKEVVSDIQPVVSEKGLDLNTSLAKNVPKIRCDQDKIMQVLVNLINNAVKFTERGSITVATTRLKNAVQVSVIDTGRGIRKEDLHKLFQSFSQIHTNQEHRPTGTGLGLTISKMIIQRHGGKMEVDARYGKGSTFSFILPIVERRARPRHKNYGK